MAAVLSLVSYSYCYSDIVNGVTNNAAADGFRWDMTNVLPPQAGLTVGGLRYRYTVDKIREDDFTVSIQNEDKISGGNALTFTDNWSGLSGNTLVKQYPLPDISIDRIGDGSITTTGVGTVTDPDVRYTYRYDECYNPLADPECPGYAEAYMAWLLENGLYIEPPEPEPVDYEVPATEIAEENQREIDETLEEEEEEEEELEKLLSIRDEADEIANAFAQAQMLLALNNSKILKPYIEADIGGGDYIETVAIEDKKINDNRSAALRMGLAQDLVHDKMVASQYDKGE